MAGADERAVDQVLAEFFVLEGDVYRHRRIDRELAKAVELSGKRRRAALVKHQKARPNGSARAMHLDTQPQPQLPTQKQDQNLSSKPEGGFDRPPGEDSIGLQGNENVHTRSSPIADLELELALKDVWEYYLTALHKNAALYKFDDDRKRKGLARLRECVSRAKEPRLENAVAMMKVCIDRLAASAFHNGENKNGKKYTDWSDHLFPKEKKLIWWLDDDNHDRRRRQQVRTDEQVVLQ